MQSVYETTRQLAFTPRNVHKAVMKSRLLLTVVCAAAIGTVALTAVACSNPPTMEIATHTLTKTYWKLTALRDMPVTVYEGQHEPYLELQPEPARVAGTDGCNRMMGSYTLDGDKIAFSKMAGTMMACANGMQQGADFTRALSLTAAWRVDGSTLTLLDADSKLLLTFEAASPKSP